MVKGVSRRVIVIKSPDPHLFEEAIFIVREDAMKTVALTGDEIIREAQEVAGKYVNNHLKKNPFSRIPAPAFALIGAVLTALCWWIAQTFL